MAYSDPGDLASGAVITEAWVDAVRADLLVSAPAVVTTKGDLVAATGANVIARLAVGLDASSLVADSGEATGLRWQIHPAAHVTKSDATTLDLTTWTSIPFDTETADDHTMHEGVTNPSRLTVPTGGDGWYTFGFFGNATRAGAVGIWRVRILLGGATVLAQGEVSGASGVASFLTISGGYKLAATNYIEAQYYTADASMTLAADPAFWAIRR